jgi:hypothetical protein
MSGHWNEDGNQQFIYKDVFGNEISIGRGINEGKASIYIWSETQSAPILIDVEDILPFTTTLQEEAKLAIASLGVVQANLNLYVCKTCGTIVEDKQLTKNKCIFCNG